MLRELTRELSFQPQRELRFDMVSMDDEELTEDVQPSRVQMRRRLLGAGTLTVTVALVLVLAVVAKVKMSEKPRAGEREEELLIESPSSCCSWNNKDCGHGGKYCQEGPENCRKCLGQWGGFQDPCMWGHPPAPPLPRIWHYHGKAELKVKVLSYNLEWWATGGGAASTVVTGSSRQTPYDAMGFQECNNPWQLLWQAGIQHEYEAMHVNHGRAVDLCIVYRNATWTLLARGEQSVANDKTFGARYAMWVRLEHIRTKERLFFMNHHGPLPLNSGGTSGGPATASALLDLVIQHAAEGDAVILVGDFNADGGSLTVRQLECRLSHVAWGDKYNGIDNVFANVKFSHIANGHGKTLHGGDSDHNALSVSIDLSPSQRPAESSPAANHTDLAAAGNETEVSV